MKALSHSCDTAREAWTILVATFKERSAGREFATYDEFHELKTVKDDVGLAFVARGERL
jgi:hypothetical protein